MKNVIISTWLAFLFVSAIAGAEDTSEEIVADEVQPVEAVNALPEVEVEPAVDDKDELSEAPVELEPPITKPAVEAPVVYKKPPTRFKPTEPVRDAFVAAVIAMPTGDGWDSGLGVEARMMWWPEPQWGYGVSLGLASWSYSQDPLDVGPADATPFRAEGDVMMLPLTALGAWRKTFDNRVELLVEVGLRYVIVDSEIKVTTAYVDHQRREVTYESYVENSNLLVGMAAVALRGPINERWMWRVGAEYQTELGGPDANWLNQDVGNDFDALTLQIGFGAAW